MDEYKIVAQESLGHEMGRPGSSPSMYKGYFFMEPIQLHTQCVPGSLSPG
jgi:hypothetical protein